MLKILEGFAGHTSIFLFDLASGFVNPYHGPFGRERYPRIPTKHALEKIFDKLNARQQERLAFSQTLYRLKRDGLLVIEHDKLSLTSRGLMRLKSLLSRRASALPDTHYEKKLDTTLKIVVFDVPESVAHKRLWLRSVLKNLDYRMLQKSVWTGKAQIPTSLLRDIRKLELLSFIEILAVTKTGTLRQIS